VELRNGVSPGSREVGDRPNSRAVSGACCGMWCSTCLRHHACTARAPVETRAATAAPADSPSASGARDEGSAALATAQAEASAVAAALAVSPRSPDTDESVPVFNIARIERTGDAVIAGRAAPGAIVELLRNGERHYRAVADQSGQFVIVAAAIPKTVPRVICGRQFEQASRPCVWS
jgi:hypothetical protein